jgi:hypothetical protein
MKNIVSRKNINKKTTYLLCNRELLSSSLPLIIILFLIIGISVQTFFLFAIIDITYACIHEPDLDCFKTNNDGNVSDSFDYNVPVNCSTISKSDFVFCYRLTALDPERAFVGAAAGYLLFKMFNFGLFILAHIMLWAAGKWKKKTFIFIKVVFTFILFLVIFIPLLLIAVYLPEAYLTIRKKISKQAITQSMLLFSVFFGFVNLLPWEQLRESKEYYEDVSPACDLNNPPP